MNSQLRLVARLTTVASLCMFSNTFAASDQANEQSKGATLSFAGVDYVHRWSKNGQNEFTPRNDADLARWHDMVTINAHETVRNGEQLADLADRVLSNYQSHGKIVRTDSRPSTAQRPAEHFIAALLGSPDFVEAAFARIVLVDGVGVVAVYSHRVYGKQAAEATDEWLKTNGPLLERTLMSWDRIPPLAALKQLRQSK